MKISRFPCFIYLGFLASRHFVALGCMAAALLCAGAAPGAESKEEEDKPPEPVAIDEITADGVNIRGTYFPGDEKNGKDTVPVILLHEHGGRGSDFGRLIEALWKKGKGYAVIVPDLRAHGASRIPGLDPDTLGPNDYVRMVTQDMETLHQFLIREHNAERLNIDRLCIIGAEMGASVALHWARLNWSKPPLAIGKQGQDVKGLVLVSPVSNTPGLALSTAMRPSAPIAMLFPTWVKQFKDPRRLDFRREIAVMILAGDKDRRIKSNAERLYKQFEGARKLYPPMPEGAKRDLYVGFFPTELQGTRLLREPALRLDQQIDGLIRKHLADRAMPHEERRERKVGR
jgi:pimeloyl-ACP methyl ester carboxylesterase